MDIPKLLLQKTDLKSKINQYIFLSNNTRNLRLLRENLLPSYMILFFIVPVPLLFFLFREIFILK